MEQLISILKEGKKNFGFLGVKAEFEAEGTRMNEMILLSQIVRKAGLNLGVKIGGCEAISDLYNTKLLGVEYIIAPMIETPYALSKYIEAKNKVYSPKEQDSVKFLFNLETITAFSNLEGMATVFAEQKQTDGIVFGRVDFVSSLGLSRDDIGSNKIQSYLDKTSSVCKEHNLDFVLGGGVSIETIEPVKKVQKNYLTRFETRKVIFDASILQNTGISLNEAIKLSVEFELAWLKYKRDYYSGIAKEDVSRISMLESRFEIVPPLSNVA